MLISLNEDSTQYVQRVTGVICNQDWKKRFTVIPVRGQMEKERSKSLQEVSEQSRNEYEPINPRQFQTRDVTAKRGKRHGYAALETAIADNSSKSVLGAVDGSYKGKKQSLLKRLSECSLSPSSEEYKFVMQGFKETGREPNSTVLVATSKRTRNRKISLSNFSQGSKYSSMRLPSEIESALTFRPRPRGNTMPARINDIRIAEETEPSVKTKAAVRKHLSVHVKVAWQSVNEDLKLPVKKGTRRHVSLSDQPQKQLSADRHEQKFERRSSETFRSDREVLSVRADRSGRKTPQRKKAEVELPKIAERVFIDHDHLPIKLKGVNISCENRRKGFTAEQNGGQNAIGGQKFLVTHPQRERRYSGGNLTEGKDTTSVKGKLTPTSSWEPRPTAENSLSRRSIDVESKHFESHLIQAPSRHRTSQFAITRANISRVGKAAIVATRLLKIHYRENGDKKAITKEEKELDKLFEEMKDCRYLRKSTSELKI